LTSLWYISKLDDLDAANSQNTCNTEG